MKISELSQKSGVSQRMLRYFEQEELLDPRRTASDYREYEIKDLNQVLEIREWQRLGLTLKEVKKLKSNPVAVDSVLESVLNREREVFLQKDRALRDLRERFLGKKSPYFGFRVAHPVPNLEKVLAAMEFLGWRSQSFSKEKAETGYHLFCSWRDEVEVGLAMFGEMISRSAFYLLMAQGSEHLSDLEQLMSDFCSAARSQWPNFDACAPKEIEIEDLGEFFGPHEIILCLKFNSGKNQDFTVILPYQALFALAQGEYGETSFLK